MEQCSAAPPGSKLAVRTALIEAPRGSRRREGARRANGFGPSRRSLRRKLTGCSRLQGVVGPCQLPRGEAVEFLRLRSGTTHRHWPTGALADSNHGLCARSGKKSRHNLRSGVPAALPYRKASPEGRNLSKVRVFGSVRKTIASEGGNKSVPCYAGLLSASSSPSLWCRSGVVEVSSALVRSSLVGFRSVASGVQVPAAGCSRSKKSVIWLSRYLRFCV